MVFGKFRPGCFSHCPALHGFHWHEKQNRCFFSAVTEKFACCSRHCFHNTVTSVTELN